MVFGAKPAYNDTSLVLSSKYDQCEYLIRCALSKGAEITCPCNGTNCDILMQHVCNPTTLYAIPWNAIIRPWSAQFYYSNRTWHDKTPSGHLYIGSFRCRGYVVVFIPQNGITIPIKNDVYISSILEKLICNGIPEKFRNNMSSHQYPLTCWNNSLTFNGRRYAFSDICPESKTLYVAVSNCRWTAGLFK